MSLFNFQRREITPETDNREKRAIVRFFEILFSKIFKILALNLLYTLCLLPMLSGLTPVICGIFNVSVDVIRSIPFIYVFVWIGMLFSSLSMPLSIVLFLASLLAYGPLTAGLTYCMKNIVSGRHIWVSDLFSKAKSNFKQGIILGILDFLVLLSFILYLSYDLSALVGAQLFIYKFLKIASVVISVVYIIIRFYTYSIAVMFELPIKDIFKNSFIFSVLGFFRNLLALAICAVIIFTFVSTPYIDIVLFAVLIFVLCRYSVLFLTYPVIDEYMLSVKKEVTEREDD